MTLANLPRWRLLALLVGCGGGILALACAPSHSGLLSGLDRRYGPTTPSGYSVRIEPQAFSMSHSQQQQVQVRVEDAVGQPVDGVLVHFLPSEGTVTTGSSLTRGGVVTGTFAVAAGSDNPRSAFIIVTVEDVDVTVFVDIVPAVFGR
jgi:hypothetical protein